MGSKSNHLENALLDHVLGGAAYTAPATVYLALYTAPPDDASGGTEVTGGSYARKGVTNNATNWPAAASGEKSLGVAQDFVAATAGWGAITGFALFDAASGGNRLYWGALTTPVTIATGDTARFPAGSIVITED